LIPPQFFGWADGFIVVVVEELRLFRSRFGIRERDA
jgi:hypothetical protein